jgi:two-component system, OmpR family, sensor kinase
MSIRKRLALWYSGLIVIIIVILSLSVITVSRVSILNSVDQDLQTTATRLTNSISLAPVGDFSTPDMQVLVGYDEIFGAPGLSLQIWNTSGADPLLLRSSSNIVDHDQPLNASALQADAPGISNGELRGVPQRILTLPFYDSADNGSQPATQMGVVQIATSLQAIYRANENVLFITLIGASISIIVSLVLALYLSRRALKPLESISEAASNVAVAEDLSVRLTWDGPQDEIGRLTSVFNHMMARLQHLFSVQQRFLADVSHELRTPLTSILGNLEIMQRYGVDTDSLDAVHREAGRMSRMVNDLLLLIRADYGELEVDFYPLDLDTVALEVYEQAHMLAKHRSLQIKLGRLEPARINGNVDRIRQLLLNLIGNAIKFTADGGEISLAVYAQGGQAVLEVNDTGIGISDEDLKRIFDRFYQADHSRAQRHETDGSGLGLSIARWIVDIHNGKIEVSSTIGQGTHFRITIPLLTESQMHHTGGSHTHVISHHANQA